MAAAAGTDEDAGTLRAKPWVGVTVMATAAMALATLLSYALGVLGPFMIPDLDLPRSALGALMTATFVTATLFSFFAGRLTDGADTRRALAVLLGFVAATFALVSAVPSYLWLVAVAAVFGAGQAVVNPVTNKLVAAHIPSDRRGIAMGVKQSGVQIGALLAGMLLPTAAIVLGWRGALRLVAVLPLLVLLLGIRAVPHDRPSTTGDTPRRGLEPPTAMVRWLMAYAFFMGGGVGAAGTYLPLYAHEQLRLHEATAGLVLSVVGITAVFARILWSNISNRTQAMAATLAGLGGGGVLSGLLLWQAAVGGTWLLWAGAIVFGVSASAWNSVGNLAVVTYSDFEATGHASGMLAVGFFAGFVVSPVAFGVAVDATGSYDVAWLSVTGQFAAATGIAVLWRRKHGAVPRRVGAP